MRLAYLMARRDVCVARLVAPDRRQTWLLRAAERRELARGMRDRAHRLEGR